jgi:LemA protein
MSTTLILVPLVMIAAMVVVVLLLMMYGVSIYNRLVTLRNRVDNAFAQIEVQLKRRHDLIPNLVETAKGYMAHERDTLEAVIQARNQAVSGLQGVSGNPGDHEAVMALAGAEKGLSGALGRMFALAEAYPDLKANQNMMQLTEELTSTENKISFARQGYNDSVTSYNTYRQTFPPVLIAGLTGHTTDRDLLEFDSAAIAEAPKVSFG